MSSQSMKASEPNKKAVILRPRLYVKLFSGSQTLSCLVSRKLRDTFGRHGEPVEGSVWEPGEI
jgi:hypothetical protein